MPNLRKAGTTLAALMLSALAVTVHAAQPPRPLTPMERDCTLTPNNPRDGYRARLDYASWISAFYLNASDGLDKTVSDWNKPNCMFDDGTPVLSVMIPGFGMAFSTGGGVDSAPQIAAQQRQRRPQSAALAIAEAEAWSVYAWQARGQGYANSVTEDGTRLFRERLERAEKILIDSKAIADVLPVWYEYLYNFQSLLGRPAAERERTFREGTGKFNNYLPLYFVVAGFLQPKWGGSWQQIEAFANAAARQTQATEGETMYARIYWSVQMSAPGTRFFTDSGASWPHMKQGFDDMMARYPNSRWNLNSYARFACIADDKKTFATLREKIGGNTDPDAWSGDPSLDLCEHKMGYAKD